MKIQFTKPHTDEFGKEYYPGWVADWSEPDAKKVIGAGIAVPAPPGAYPRKTADASFACATPGDLAGDIMPTGEQITVDELKTAKPPKPPNAKH